MKYSIADAIAAVAAVATIMAHLRIHTPHFHPRVCPVPWGLDGGRMDYHRAPRANCINSRTNSRKPRAPNGRHWACVEIRDERARGRWVVIAHANSLVALCARGKGLGASVRCVRLGVYAHFVHAHRLVFKATMYTPHAQKTYVLCRTRVHSTYMVDLGSKNATIPSAA